MDTLFWLHTAHVTRSKAVRREQSIEQARSWQLWWWRVCQIYCHWNVVITSVSLYVCYTLLVSLTSSQHGKVLLVGIPPWRSGKNILLLNTFTSFAPYSLQCPNTNVKHLWCNLATQRRLAQVNQTKSWVFKIPRMATFWLPLATWKQKLRMTPNTTQSAPFVASFLPAHARIERLRQLAQQ